MIGGILGFIGIIMLYIFGHFLLPDETSNKGEEE